MALHFEDPPALALLLVMPLLALLYARYVSRRKATVLRFSSLGTVRAALGGSSAARRHLPFALMAASAGLAIVALAGPQVPSEGATPGMNLSIVLDVSESMGATDYSPTRLGAAKEAVGRLVAGMGPADHVGIITFESGATTVSYLTPDRARTLAAVSAIVQGRGATAIGDGLALGVDMASSVPGRRGAVVLLSDGIHNSGLVTPDEAVRYARAGGVQVHTVGLGSAGPVYIRDDVYGNPQYAELDEEALAGISRDTGGTYSKSLDGGSLGAIFEAIGGGLRTEPGYEGVGRWFAGGAAALLLACAYLIYGRYRIAA